MAVVLRADVVLDLGATETASGVEAVQLLVECCDKVFPNLSVVTAAGLFQESGCQLPRVGSAFRLWMLETLPVLAGMNLLGNPDIYVSRNEFLVHEAEGNPRSVPLRRFPSGHRILNLLS